MGTYYVDASRPDDSGDGLSWATAKQTIQAMVNAVSTGTHHDIYIAGGTYAETANNHLLINRSGLDVSLIAKEGETPILATTHANYCLYINNAAKFVGRGLTLAPASGAAAGAVYCYRPTIDWELYDCLITPITSGIVADAGTSIVIQDCTVLGGTSYSVVLKSVDRVHVVGCDITSGISNAALDVRGSGANYALLKDNVVTTTGQNIGIVLYNYVARGQILGNTVICAGASAGPGIQVNEDMGTTANPCGPAMIAGNTVRFTGAGSSHGILLGGSSTNCVVTGNLVVGADYPVVLKGASACAVYGNCLKGTYGVYIKGAKNNTIMHNSIISAGRGCLHWTDDNGTLDDSTGNWCLSNICDASSGTGFCYYNHESTASNETHGNNFFDYNLLIPNTNGKYARMDGMELSSLATLRAKWAGSWANGGTYYMQGTDANTVTTAGSPFANPTATAASMTRDDFAVRFTSAARGAAMWHNADIGGVQRRELVAIAGRAGGGVHYGFEIEG